MRNSEEICPDLHEWPERWKLDENDVPYGKALLDAMRPFIEHLISAGLQEKTIEDHIDNLWLLGGEIIRNVNLSTDSGLSLPRRKEAIFSCLIRRGKSPMVAPQAPIRRQNLQVLALALSGLVQSRPGRDVGSAPHKLLSP